MEGHCGRTGTVGRSLSLIIPAFNEEAGIRQAIDEADRELAELVSDYEILVVDDGSRDRTACVVAEAAAGRPHVRLLRHAENRGYGAALRTGFEAARHDRVAFTDADCQFYLADLAALLSLTEDVPVAVGYRVRRQDPWQRRFYSWGYNTLVRALLGTGVRDCDCALKVFRKEALAAVLPESRGFFVNAEVLTRARRLGYEVAEAGVRHRPRQRGSSKVSLADIPRTLRTLLPFWWSRVLFPQSPLCFASAGSRNVNGWLDGRLWVLVLAAALLCFARLNCPLQEPEEPRYAEIPRQMLEADSLLVPLLHGLPYYDKPPLLYWLVMATYGTFGIHDWAARLASAGATFLTVLVTYLWGRRVAGSRAAFAGALMLCLSARFLYLGRLLTMNSLLCLWVVTSLAAAHVALAGAHFRWGWWLVSALACGLGCLTKGPVALVLVGVPVLIYPLLEPRVPRPGGWAWITYLAVAAGLAGPWYVALAVTDPPFAGYFFWKHNVVRFLAPFDHEEAPWFYLPGLLAGMLPWSLLLPSLLKSLAPRSAATAAHRPAAIGFCLLAALWCLLFYSVAGCKRAGYILPAMPTLALALGCHLEALLAQVRLGQAGLQRTCTLLAYRAHLLVLAAGLGGSVLSISMGIVRPAYGIGLAGAAATGLVLLLRGRGMGLAGSWGACAATTFVLLLAAVHLALPGYARRFSMRGQIRPQAEFCAEQHLPVLCYPRRWDSVSYYLRRNDVQVYTPEQRANLFADLESQSRALLVVKSNHALSTLVQEMPASLEFLPRGRQGNVTVGLVRPRR